MVKGLRTAYKVGRGMLEQIGDATARRDDARPSEPEAKPADQPARGAAADPVPSDGSEPDTSPDA